MDKEANKNVATRKTALPIVNIPFMSDYKWQYECLQDRLKAPDKYRAIGEDVEATIEHLKKWLTEHATEATQIPA
ncbi:MAG: hypothetical protein IKU08_00840 [Clostridia bacterium]|nr:hypothetical protein [Clostridia bacterium]